MTARPCACRRRRCVVAARMLAGALLAGPLLTACGGTPTSREQRHPATTGTTQARMGAATTTAVTGSTAACHASPPPARYAHVVVVMMENRTWGQVGGPGFRGMPYLASLASQCAYYDDWTNTNPQQSSLTQYIGLTSGVDNPNTVGDCSPSAGCSSTDDNIFRQVRERGGTARSYVEGATSHCSADGNAVRHVPALYYRGTYQDAAGTHRDSDFCADEVVPFSELDPSNLPTFAIVTPTLCHDGHDCGNTTVDDWARDHLGPLLTGNDYRAGTTALFVLWDESDPVPNLIVAPSARPGPRPGTGSHASAFRTFEALLGLPVLQQGQVASSADVRPSAPL